ncbi:MAG: RnfH family protein [Magnetococcales bacterium]|nr:RnfH family protein [Magnetococcales bacterium]
MKVSVAYAEAKRQIVAETEVAEGASVEQAIRQSGILKKCAEIDLTKNKAGVYGKVVPLDQVVKEGDRIEIYRPAVGKPPKKGAAAAKGAEAAEDSDEES